MHYFYYAYIAHHAWWPVALEERDSAHERLPVHTHYMFIEFFYACLSGHSFSLANFQTNFG